MKDYFDFIEAHLAVERSLLARLKDNAEHRLVEKEAAKWLCCSSRKANNAFKKYPGVMRLLYWLALVELGMKEQGFSYSELRDDDLHTFSIKKYLPKIENGKYVGGVEQWIKHYGELIAEHAGEPIDGSRPSRKTLSNTLARFLEENHRLTHAKMAKPPSLEKRYESNAIDERLGRYVSGKEHLGVHEIHEILGSNGAAFSLHNIAITLIGQLDDFVRTFDEFTNFKVDELSEVYDLYPCVSDAVEKRFKHFCKSGLLLSKI